MLWCVPIYPLLFHVDISQAHIDELKNICIPPVIQLYDNIPEGAEKERRQMLNKLSVCSWNWFHHKNQQNQREPLLYRVEPKPPVKLC